MSTRQLSPNRTLTNQPAVMSTRQLSPKRTDKIQLLDKESQKRSKLIDEILQTQQQFKNPNTGKKTIKKGIDQSDMLSNKELQETKNNLNELLQMQKQTERIEKTKTLSKAQNSSLKKEIGKDLSEIVQINNEERREKLKEAKAHDIWSLAMVFYELALGLGHFPFEIYTVEGKAVTDQQLYENIARAPYIAPNYRLDDGRTNVFLQKMSINDWRLRPTINEMLLILTDDILSKVH